MLYTQNLPKAASEHNSKTQIAVGASRSCGAVARARTLGVNMLSENAFKEMPTLANRWSNFRFSSGIQVYFWMQRTIFHLPSRLSKRTRAFSPPRARFLRPPIARRSFLLPIASWQVRLLAQVRPAEHVDSGLKASRRSGCSPLTKTRRWPRRA